MWYFFLGSTLTKRNIKKVKISLSGLNKISTEIYFAFKVIIHNCLLGSNCKFTRMQLGISENTFLRRNSVTEDQCLALKRGQQSILLFTVVILQLCLVNLQV